MAPLRDDLPHRSSLFYTFFMRKMLAVTVINLALIFSISPGVQAASKDTAKPVVTWGCTLTRQVDHQGMYLFFQPQAKVKWQGKQLSYKFYGTTDKTLPLTNNLIGQGTVTSTGKGTNDSALYLSRKFRKFVDFKYLKLLVIVTDLEKQSNKAKCVWTGKSAAGF